jgi:hypothetical protein
MREQPCLYVDDPRELEYYQYKEYEEKQKQKQEAEVMVVIDMYCPQNEE